MDEKEIDNFKDVVHGSTPTEKEIKDPSDKDVDKPKKQRNIRPHIIFLLLILISGTVFYSNTFQNEFVWDDDIYIINNFQIKDLKYLPTFFYTPVHGNLYRPLREVDKAVVYRFFGFNVFGHHLNALLLHLIISVLVYLIVYTLSKKKWFSFFSGLFFVLHPIHTGRVTNMTASYDMVGIVFLFLAFLFYLLYQNPKKGRYLFYSFIIYILALLGSEEAITLPVIIIFYELVFNNALKNYKQYTYASKRFFYSIILITAIYLWARVSIVRSVGRGAFYPGDTFYNTIITMPKVILKYIYLLIFPFNLNLEHYVPIEQSLLGVKVLLPIIILVFILYILYWFFKQSQTDKSSDYKLIAFFIGWFFITMILFYNFIPLYTFLAERYLYVPSLAFVVLLSLLFTKIFAGKLWIKKNAIIIGLILLIIVSGFYGYRTMARNSDWRTDIVLWEKTFDSNPLSSRASNNLGQAYERKGDLDRAFFYFSKAIELDPENPFAYNNLGIYYANTGNYNYSIVAFVEAIKIHPNYYQAYDNVGLAYLHLGNHSKALYAIRKSIDINPNFYKSHNDLGTVYAKMGDYERAEESFLHSLKINPDYEDARKNLEVLRRLRSQPTIGET